ncbi:hypothetical protein [Cellulomonas sp. PhB143]|uniref:hypothetical protein n=1 Tax=Cellulomonas sp. PhB143 TaxID=2485186 RepID=UPI000F49600D|nr:hypothetical protein [Cellulomonas sp. PhB143]ROS79096.1 hypothetical protein EDF32_0142 [Cellulomonas sp. PhB143]
MSTDQPDVPRDVPPRIQPQVPPYAPDAEPPLDPAEGARLIREQRERTGTQMRPDGRILYGVWGVAWLLGFGALWTTTGAAGDYPTAWAFVVYGVMIVVAMVVTIVHSVRRASGVRGPSARTGAMYGWAWFLGFLVMNLVVAGVSGSGVDADVVALVANGAVCLVVGLMYLMSALLWGDGRLYVLGVWILLVGGAASLVGMPTTYLVMALAGGGGFLAMAVVTQLGAGRRRRAVAGRQDGSTVA